MSAKQRECRPNSRHGLSLLEVILALAILGVACTVMMNAMQVTVMNALKAQREAEAEICAESVLNQIVAGMIPVQPSSAWTPVSINASTSKWSYMIMQVNAEVQNMVGIQVMVRDTTNPNVNAPADFSVIRWIIDPSLGLDTPPATDETGQTDQSGTGQSGTGTGTGTSTAGGTSGKM